MLCDRCGYEGSSCPFPQEDHCELFKEITTYCQHCDKEVPKSAMRFTYDCHGIPFRFVCPSCYDELMERGYDGEYYDETMEQIDDDY
jgi:hypothetical protein